MRLSQIIKSLKSIFEIKRKNPIQLNNDSNLESNLKPLKVSDKNTPIQISEDTVDVKGSLKVNGTDVATGASVSELNDLSDVTYSSGDLTISSLDKIVASSLEIETDTTDITNTSARDFIVDSGRYVILDSSGAIWYFKASGTNNAFFRASSLSLLEDSDAHSDSAGYGQIWVKDDTPNELCFTDDAGTDIVGIGKYQYTIDAIGYSAGSATSVLPIGGYVFEQTLTSGRNEFNALCSPFNGTLEKVMFRSEIAQNGTIQFDILEASDNTEVPATDHGTKDSVVNIADDTTLEIDLSSMTTGTNVLTKGNLYIFKITTPSNSLDTNVTLVFKWDITS